MSAIAQPIKKGWYRGYINGCYMRVRPPSGTQGTFLIFMSDISDYSVVKVRNTKNRINTPNWLIVLILLKTKLSFYLALSPVGSAIPNMCTWR